jgi:predicted transcriptional regulator
VAKAPVSVKLPDELLERLDRAAEAERRSRGNLIRLAVEQYLDRNHSPQPSN